MTFLKFYSSTSSQWNTQLRGKVIFKSIFQHMRIRWLKRMKLSSLHILHVQYTTRILLEGEKIKYKMCEGTVVKTNCYQRVYILILYIVYRIALVVINIVKCRKTVKCFDYYAQHLWPKRHIFLLFSPIEQMIHYSEMVPQLKNQAGCQGSSFSLAPVLVSVITMVALLIWQILRVCERKATKIFI